jgi:hypothetical protein
VKEERRRRRREKKKEKRNVDERCRVIRERNNQEDVSGVF